MTAALGVVLDTLTNTQRFFGAGIAQTSKGHTDDITAISIHSDKDTVLTGQVGRNPLVCLWKASDPESGPVLTFKIGKGRQAVSAAAISSCGKYAAIADMAKSHYVSVWDLFSSQRVS